jgi:hypothetical protein
MQYLNCCPFETMKIVELNNVFLTLKIKSLILGS